MTNYPAGPSPYAPPPRDPVPGQLGPNGSPGYPYGPDSAHAREEEAAASSSRTPLIIIGVLVLIIVMAAMALFSVRLLTNSASTPPEAVAPVAPAPVELDGPGIPEEDLGGAGDGSLPLHFSVLVPPDTETASTQCRTGMLTIHPETTAPYDVEGTRCLLAGTQVIGDRPIEFLADAGWARYIDALLQGAVPGHDVQLLNTSGTVSVGTSRALTDDTVTLHYVDTYAQLAVEVIDVENASEAARIALELGWL